ncbi:integration host factor subunit beta [Pseudidiomarina sp.]|uniref:integration host factor subunit beta n=1 Tax=Pseudidiomarina sp. TaxID=2081707 RepID=UPI003A96FD51
MDALVEEHVMTKSELISQLSKLYPELSPRQVEDAVKELIEQMAQYMASGGRIEIRGFGSFSLHYRAPREGRNPKTGEKVQLDGKYVPHFKPGKELRERVDNIG